MTGRNSRFQPQISKRLCIILIAIRMGKLITVSLLRVVSRAQCYYAKRIYGMCLMRWMQTAMGKFHQPSWERGSASGITQSTRSQSWLWWSNATRTEMAKLTSRNSLTQSHKYDLFTFYSLLNAHFGIYLSITLIFIYINLYDSGYGWSWWLLVQRSVQTS